KRFTRKPPKKMELVMEDLKLWQTGVLKVSFKGGDVILHKAIADTAAEWTKYANIVFDFGYNIKANTYRLWVSQDTSPIRVGFDESGYWSWVGTQSVDEAFCKPGEITLNLEGFDKILPNNWQSIVLHEFGHALGFHHEHQSPVSDCDFNWPTLYDYLAGSPNNWSKETVDYNLRKMAASGLTYSPHDRSSIMHYSFPAWMFVSGEASPCYIPENTSLSEEDKRMAQKAYPFSKESIAKQRKERVKNLKVVLDRWKNVRVNEIFFAERDESKEYKAKKCILIGAGQANENPDNLEDAAKLNNLLPSSYAYNLCAELLDELVKTYVTSASFTESELSGCRIMGEVIDLVRTKTNG
ncbi:MAG TPA: M12 family metallopeptidase, partial [Pseudosphingobacterium sp.]|nr:M12 family metallopeptidase [Pseudosphingobacterium sp.]